MLKNDRKEKRRPHSLDVSELFNGMTDSTINTTTSQLWRPGPLSEGRDAEVSHKRELLSDVLPFIGKQCDPPFFSCFVEYFCFLSTLRYLLKISKISRMQNWQQSTEG